MGHTGGVTQHGCDAAARAAAAGTGAVVGGCKQGAYLREHDMSALKADQHDADGAGGKDCVVSTS